MRPATIRRRTVAVALAAVATAVPTAGALLPGSALARPIGDLGAPKDCKLGGTRIGHGSRGRHGGVEYECRNGVACQVEQGRTTDKCSHAARLDAVRAPGGGRLLLLARR